MSERRFSVRMAGSIGASILVLAAASASFLGPHPSDAATVQSRSSSCAGFAFQPLDSDT
jgi:hypothetical protein